MTDIRILNTPPSYPFSEAGGPLKRGRKGPGT